MCASGHSSKDLATTSSLPALSNPLLLWALESSFEKGEDAGGGKATTKPRSQLFLKLKHETLQPAFTFTHVFLIQHIYGRSAR